MMRTMNALKTYISSFPRRRESMVVRVDSRLRGNDGGCGNDDLHRYSRLKTRACSLLAALMFPLIALSAPIDDYFTAIKNDNDGALVTVLFRGFDANTLDSDGRHGLHIAMMEGSFKVAKTLLDLSGTKVDTRSKSDETPLMMAALKGNTEFAKRLIARGADVYKTGWTPLHYAATGGHVEMIKLLLENHAYIDTESPNKTTPLMMAAQYGNAQSVKLLIEEGADITLKNDVGMTALDFSRLGESRASFDVLTAALKETSKPAPMAQQPAPAAVPVAPAVEPAGNQPFKTRSD
jgi:ankyrin repeat protein